MSASSAQPDHILLTICLVIPPSPFLLDERVFMSLGILKVASALEARGRKVEVLDLSGVANYGYAVAEHIRSSGATIYGLTATSPQLPAAAAIADQIRLYGAPETRIILGGPHATLVNAAHKRAHKLKRETRAERALSQLFERFDVLVAGDGERAVIPALSAPSGSVIDADDRKSPWFLHDEDVETSALPARHLVDVESYRYTIDGIPALSLIAQLGCPFGCGFCAGRHSPMLRHIRQRSAESIVAEMLSMHAAYGTRGFMFYDDELNVSRGLVDLMGKIAEAQRKLNVEWRLRGFVKAELFDDKQAAAMQAAGFRWVLIGFESGSDRILANINKKATKQDNTRAIAIARRNGLKVKALMSLGHPGESAATVAETRDWLLDVRPDDFDATIITPYPGSPYYDDAKLYRGEWIYNAANGDRLYQADVDYVREADYYKGDPDDGYVSHVRTDSLSSEGLVAARGLLEGDVRQDLDIPFNGSAPAMLYEHSMGQLPSHLLRASP